MLRRAMLANPSYQALGPVCKHTVAMVEVAQRNTMLPSSCTDVATVATKLGASTVSVTFALFHITVEFPKLGGEQNMQAAGLALKTQLSNSGGAWKDLPQCLCAAIGSFGF